MSPSLDRARGRGYPGAVAGPDSPSTAFPGPERLPFRQIGGWRLVALLGEGPGSSRYLCKRDEASPARLLDLLPGGLEPAVVERVRREAEAAMRVNHPGLLQPLEIGEHHGRPFLVSDHVAGPTLAERREKEGRLPPAEALEIVGKLLEAMAEAHAQGIRHRSLEPGLVLLDAKSGSPRVSGFALAPASAAARLTSSARDGPPPRGSHYQPPELFRGAALDARADVFSIGVIAYELFTGARPFTGKTAAELAERLRTGGAQPPSRRQAGLDPRLDEVLLSAIAPDPQGRPADARAFLAALRLATAAPRAARTRRRARQSPLVWAGALASGGLVGAGLGVWPLLSLREAQAAVLAETRLVDAERAERAKLEAELGRVADEESQLVARREQLERERRVREDERHALQVRLAVGEEWLEARRRQRAEPVLHTTETIAPLLEQAAAVPAAAGVRARWLHHLGAGAEALAALELGARQPHPPPELPVIEVQVLAALGKTQEVQARMVGLAEGPPSPEGLWARSHDQRLSREERVGLLEKAIAARPQAGWLHAALHQALESGDMDRPELLRALEVANEALRWDPLDPDMLYNRSHDLYRLWAREGRAADSPRVQGFMSDLYRARAIRLVPSFWSYAGKSHCMFRRPAQALAELEVGLALARKLESPREMALARIWLGAARAQTGHAAEAARDVEESMVRGVHPELLAALAELTPQERNALVEHLSTQARQALSRGR